MANRSYLYASNLRPAPENESEIRFKCLSECNYALPLIYLILVSENTQAILSSIWDHPDEMAIVGDFQAGLKKLKAFFAQIEHEEAQTPIREALAFLEAPANQDQYIVLEPGEIYSLLGDNFAEQNQGVVRDIGDIGREIQRTVNALAAGEALDPDGLTGFQSCYWSNVLYFDLSPQD